MAETTDPAVSWNDANNDQDYARICAVWADADMIPRLTLIDLLEIAHDQLTAWIGERTLSVGETSKKLAEIYYAMDHWSSLRGGNAQVVGPDGFQVQVSTWQLVLKARDLLFPPQPAYTRLG